jgi:hypothetical protein
MTITESHRASLYAALLPPLANRYGAFEVARWFLLGVNEKANCRSMRSAMNAKCRPPGAKARKGVTYADSLAIQLLHFMDLEGYDLGQMTFGSYGELLDIPRRVKGMSNKNHFEGYVVASGDAEDRAAIYSAALSELTDRYGAANIASLFLLGSDDNASKSSMRSFMNAKCRSAGSKARKGVTYVAALAVQLMLWLHKNGYDIASMEFEYSGELRMITRRPL